MSITAVRDLRIKSNGAWKNVVTFRADRTEQVKTACEALLLATGGDCSFKITDIAGRTLHALDARTEPVGWSDR